MNSQAIPAVNKKTIAEMIVVSKFWDHRHGNTHPRSLENVFDNYRRITQNQ